MGSLIIPPDSQIYLDTNALIYSVEKIEPYATLLQPLWMAAQSGQNTLWSSELVLLDTLVKPLQAQDTMLESVYRALLLESNELRLTPITLPILEQAAWLRAQRRLRTPDAIHVATAIAAACAVFVTNDEALARITELPVVLLSQYVTAIDSD